MQMTLVGGNLGAPREVYSINFGDSACTHVGMKPIGEMAASGLRVSTLEEVFAEVDGVSHGDRMIDLSENVDAAMIPFRVPDAAVLVLKGGVDRLIGEGGTKKVYAEMRKMPRDKESLAWGEVKNVHKYHSVLISDFEQEADIKNRQSTVVRFEEHESTNLLRSKIARLISLPTESIVADIDHYFDTSAKSKCGISWHGISERKIIVGARFGSNEMPLRLQWHFKGALVGREEVLHLEAGDIYLLSEKAVGNDKSCLSISHSVGQKSTKRRSSELM